uniref:TCTP domain-containing protein n=1 Tax=Cyclophora tenuis TaxID=216820 RepID=A0A7S1DEZ1_CYCTE|mmetsp:Transcript_9966/g.16695  ORF Transcript_9966/g.16695 Transcript_9966/m.16695 type:complete len:180 (+) Transcript_9966:78-617(+)|eukprot:CAMPEP_0116557328 /NCGR_PEP_ID=MMETSP0397-20121206/9177_1 /TAXON_ID=216820 /ORGANISM="Cyclophora tenuis, Strain ECT3854" /LENGTH=179 /DNA_ID=CAMNT_0004082769 /DNA_START=64 /DNA_END=603 /DNA_ORIENTATION=-
MIIYKCRFTGDEMLSDAFKPRPVKDDDGNEVVGLIEIASQKVNKDSGASVDIGCGSEFGGGDADVDDGAELVNNVIDETIGFDLHEVPMGKKDMKDYLGAYCKALRQKLKEDDSVPGPEVKAFTQSAPAFCKWLLSKYDDMQFFTSSSMDPDGSMAFAYYEGVNPTFVFIKAGLLEEKC